jgi:hypothetical protein
MEKIIFLDIDGVLNVYCQDRDEYGCTFHKHFEDNLKWIIEQTNAKIVISSTWRTNGLERLQNMWIVRSLAGEIIDITPPTSHIVKIGICEFYDEVCRGHEIQQWLDENKYVGTYCIIDDDNDMLESHKNNFVKTSGNMSHPDCIDIGYGLTRICAEKVINILNKKN